MPDPKPPKRIFPEASTDARAAAHVPSSPQTESAAYRLAFQYPDTFASAGIFGMGAASGETQQIKSWLSAMNDENRVRVFLDCGDEDVASLRLAEAMKPLLDEAGVENQLHVGSGGHNYTYWLSNFEMYLKWVSQDWN